MFQKRRADGVPVELTPAPAPMDYRGSAIVVRRACGPDEAVPLAQVKDLVKGCGGGPTYSGYLPKFVLLENGTKTVQEVRNTCGDLFVVTKVVVGRPEDSLVDATHVMELSGNAIVGTWPIGATAITNTSITFEFVDKAPVSVENLALAVWIKVAPDVGASTEQHGTGPVENSGGGSQSSGSTGQTGSSGQASNDVKSFNTPNGKITLNKNGEVRWYFTGQDPNGYTYGNGVEVLMSGIKIFLLGKDGSVSVTSINSEAWVSSTLEAYNKAKETAAAIISWRA